MEKETLEEAAERNHNEQKLNTYTSYSFNDAFKDGAKWQAERMYSEEDFKEFARNYYREIRLDKSNLLWVVLADKCFEQFKKK